MSADRNYKIELIGWCKDVSRGMDKIWGYVSLGDTYYNFWGARGKKFTFKRYEGIKKWDLEALSRDKLSPNRKNGTYVRVPEDRVIRIIPDFESEFEKQLTLAKLFDNFHGERVKEE
jgi:hypothetical protein